MAIILWSRYGFPPPFSRRVLQACVVLATPSRVHFLSAHATFFFWFTFGNHSSFSRKLFPLLIFGSFRRSHIYNQLLLLKNSVMLPQNWWIFTKVEENFPWMTSIVRISRSLLFVFSLFPSFTSPKFVNIFGLSPFPASFLALWPPSQKNQPLFYDLWTWTWLTLLFSSGCSLLFVLNASNFVFRSSCKRDGKKSLRFIFHLQVDGSWYVWPPSSPLSPKDIFLRRNRSCMTTVTLVLLFMIWKIVFFFFLLSFIFFWCRQCLMVSIGFVEAVNVKCHHKSCEDQDSIASTVCYRTQSLFLLLPFLSLLLMFLPLFTFLPKPRCSCLWSPSPFHSCSIFYAKRNLAKPGGKGGKMIPSPALFSLWQNLLSTLLCFLLMMGL